jgi:putative membrane protein
LAAGNDPRVYFAAERTLLAWLRTGIAVIGVGFLVARFGLFLNYLRHDTQYVTPGLGSTMLGLGFVLLGTVGILGAALQFRRFLATLDDSERPPDYWYSLALGYSLVMAALGLVLTVYLAFGVST